MDAQGSDMTHRSPLEDCTSKTKWYCFLVAACMFHNPGVYRGRKCKYDPIKTKINETETGENNPGLTAAAGREIPFFPRRHFSLVFVSLHARPYSSRAANFLRHATHVPMHFRSGDFENRYNSSVLFSAKEIWVFPVKTGDWLVFRWTLRGW